ncbi:unnamed protein product [Heligmosomoides polygyrus]|uniref:Transposase n=1 Tax=Heligmosomoides polygyrus TaxID=6339 RepID=A0A183G1V3_HELPZ|nr:unnamed protein product [Heligmosomoides polygyrus]
MRVTGFHEENNSETSFCLGHLHVMVARNEIGHSQRAGRPKANDASTGIAVNWRCTCLISRHGKGDGLKLCGRRGVVRPTASA